MRIITKDTNNIPYTANRHQIISIGGDPIPKPGEVSRCITSHPKGKPKNELYWSTDSSQAVEWTDEEMLTIYKLRKKIDIEMKAVFYTGRLDYRIRYYNDTIATGGTLTPAEQTDLNDRQLLSIQAKNYIHNVVITIDEAIKVDEVDIKYNEFIQKYKNNLKKSEGIT